MMSMSTSIGIGVVFGFRGVHRGQIVGFDFKIRVDSTSFLDLDSRNHLRGVEECMLG